MAILDEKNMYGGGMVKEIEASAIGLVLQNLQQDQYQYPIKSYIREVVSNCVDSNDEKKLAQKIIAGEAKVEDYFATTESELTKDSEFDSSYYNPEYLSDDDTVQITYLESTGNRDKVTIEDFGVGLGGDRLRGYFRPA